jgi:hypothetical protein
MKKIILWLGLLGIASFVSGCAHDDPFFKSLLTAPSTESAETAVPTPAYRYCQSCLLDEDGKQVEPASGLRGDLESAELRDGQIVLVGWAADVEAGTSAKLVVLVGDAGVVATAVPALPRPDVSAALKLDSTNAFGFEISAPEEKVGKVAAIWVIDANNKAARLQKTIRR